MPADIHILPWRQLDADWRRRWLEQWQRSGASPDLSPMWADALVAGHGVEAACLQVLIAGSPSEPRLIWPFQVRTRRQRLGLPIRWIEPLQNTFCMHSGLMTSLSESEACRLILATLREWSRPWDWIDIAAVEAGSALHAAWREAAAAQRCRLRAVRGERPPYIREPGSFADFVAARSRNFRKKVRAQLRELDTDPSLRLRVYETAAEMPAFLGEVLEIERQSWKHAVGQAISSRNWELGFYQQLLASLAPLHAVKGVILYVDGQPAAHSIDLLHGARVYGLKTSYDARFADRGVGTLILVGMLARYFDAGCQEYDFLGTDETYKLYWTNELRQHLSLLLYNRTTAGRMFGHVHAAAQILREWRARRDAAAAATMTLAATAAAVSDALPLDGL